MENLYRQEQNIFNGRFKLITEDNEFKMSLWVKGFGIIDNTTEEEVLAFMSDFNLDDFKETGNVLKVKFKIYPNGAKQYEADIDPFTKTFIYNGKTIALENFANAFNE